MLAAAPRFFRLALLSTSSRPSRALLLLIRLDVELILHVVAKNPCSQGPSRAGAGDLLDVGTLRQLRAVDKDSRLAAEDIKHFQELTASVLVPQLNHERTFFYDPSTRKLLPQYDWYPTAFQNMVDYCDKIRPEIDELRKRIKEERKRNR